MKMSSPDIIREDNANTLMTHSVSGNTLTNARNHSFHTVQGHHHGLHAVERYRDCGMTRWSMSVGCLLDPDSPAARYGSGASLRIPILGLGALLGGDLPTLIISDMHVPYEHPHAMDFLRELQKYYRFKRVLNVGDLIDHHAGSYHESEPDALSPEEEYHEAGEKARALQRLFPHMIITQGNHDRIPQRKMITSGLPASMLSDYNLLYGLKDTWRWCNKYYFDAKGGYPVTIPFITDDEGNWDGNILRLKAAR